MNIRGRRALPEDGNSDKFDATRIIAEDRSRLGTEAHALMADREPLALKGSHSRPLAPFRVMQAAL
jgi:hypothetical protein